MFLLIFLHNTTGESLCFFVLFVVKKILRYAQNDKGVLGMTTREKLFHRHRFGEVAWLVDIRALGHRDVIGE